MNSITLLAPVRKTWTDEKFKFITEEIVCFNCSSIDTFQYLYTSNEWYWDIDIPDNWTFGQWEKVKLFPVQIPLPVFCCLECGQMIKVIPSFCLRGTTLTLQALIFISFVYEFSELTWRDLPEKFCDENNKIAHSTLYKAVHGTGKLVATEQAIENLCLKYLPSGNTVEPDSFLVMPPPKSLFTHTIAREKGIRRLLRNLLPGKAPHIKPRELFYRYINSLNRIFAAWGKSISRLYNKIKVKYILT